MRAAEGHRKFTHLCNVRILYFAIIITGEIDLRSNAKSKHQMWEMEVRAEQEKGNCDMLTRSFELKLVRS